MTGVKGELSQSFFVLIFQIPCLNLLDFFLNFL